MEAQINTIRKLEAELLQANRTLCKQNNKKLVLDQKLNDLQMELKSVKCYTNRARKDVDKWKKRAQECENEYKFYKNKNDELKKILQAKKKKAAEYESKVNQQLKDLNLQKEGLTKLLNKQM